MVTDWILLVCPTLFDDLVLMLEALEVCSLVKLLDDVCPTVVVLYTVVEKREDVWLSSVLLYAVVLTA